MFAQKMANLSTTLAVFFLLSVFSNVLALSDLPQIALTTAYQLPESDQNSLSTEILLPTDKPQSEPVKLVEFKHDDAAKTTDPKSDVQLEPLTLVRFRPVNRHFPGRQPFPFHHRRGCGHHRRFRPVDLKRDIPYGADMIASDKRMGLGSEISWVEFHPHQHGPRSVLLDEAEFKGPRHYDDDDEDDFQHKHKKEEREENRDNHHKHKHDDEDEHEGGLGSVKKFSRVHDDHDEHKYRKHKHDHDHDDDDDDEHEHKHKHKNGLMKRVKKFFDHDSDDEDDGDDDDDDRYEHKHAHHKKFLDDHEEDDHDHHKHGHEDHEHEHKHEGGLTIMKRFHKFLDHF